MCFSDLVLTRACVVRSPYSLFLCLALFVVWCSYPFASAPLVGADRPLHNIDIIRKSCTCMLNGEWQHRSLRRFATRVLLPVWWCWDVASLVLVYSGGFLSDWLIDWRGNTIIFIIIFFVSVYMQSIISDKNNKHGGRGRGGWGGNGW